MVRFFRVPLGHLTASTNHESGARFSFGLKRVPVVGKGPEECAMKDNRMSRMVWRTLATATVAFCVLGGAAQGETARRHRYEIVPWTQGWIAAKADAESKGGHLATITSAEEWATVTNMFGTDLMKCWLGGTDEEEEGVWKWITGEKWEFSYWADGEPNNDYEGENYLHVWDRTSLVWNDLRNNDSLTMITKYLLECDYNTNITLTTTAGAFGKAGGSGTIGTAGNGEWNARADVSWITLVKASGLAGEACTYKVGENTSGKVREGQILIEGLVYTVIQTLEAYNTNITITTTGRTFDKAGGAASVLTGGSGSWNAQTDVDWITLSRASGSAGVSCIYAVGANFTADTRTGTIYIEDKVYTVMQTGYTAGISPELAEWACAGGSGSIAVTVDAGVAWTVVPNADWISVNPESGRSSGTVTYTVAAYDETTPRSGSVTIAGQTFIAKQSGTDVTLSPMEKTLDWRANAFEVAVGALSTTTWTPIPEASWLSVVDAGYGRGNATILVAVGENPSALTRTGTVAVGSKKITVTQTGTTDLMLELTPEDATASAVGAYGNIAVYATPDANWTAAATVEWITISDGTSGAGNGNIKYIVMANSLLTERTGQIKVTLTPGSAGGTALTAVHTVTQGVIDPVVSPTEVSFGAAGGNAKVQLTVADNTQWTAKSNNGWLKVTSATSSAGSATVAFDAAANPSTEPRSGSLEIAGKTVTVTQAGLWSRLNYDGKVFGTSSDSGFIDVQVEGDGTWTASTDASWLTLMDTNGHGSASIMFVVDDYNTAVASRTAVVTIAGKTVEITQRGYELSIDPAVAELGSNAGAGEIGISAPIDALWEAIVTVDWIRLVGETTGLGNGTLRYTVADNGTGELRTGKIIISGQEYMVTQHANLTLTALVEGSGSVEGAGDYETNERVTLRAVPAEGYAFTHWSGDAVGVESEVTIVMDMAKTVTAHFIPEDAAQRLAEEKAAQGGFYTREQLKALAMGDTVIEVDGESGTVDLALQLLETTDLVGGDWDGADVPEGNGSVTVDAEGKVHVRVAPKGNTAFYRLVNVTEGEE